MQYLRSLVFLVVMVVSVVPYALVLILAGFLPHRYRYAIARGWVNLTIGMLRTICSLDYEVTGRENIPAESGVAYLKHSSTWETLAETQVFPTQTWVLKRELMWLPIFGWGLALLKPIAINRRAHRSAVRQVIHQGRERLADGLWIMIFPEGTRMAPGQTRRYGMSGALLAAETGCPLVPVAHNAGDFWPRHSLLKRPGTIRMVIGPPIATKGRRPDEITLEAREWIEATMREISVHH